MKYQNIITILEELGEIIETKNIFIEHYKREAEELKRKLHEIEKGGIKTNGD